MASGATALPTTGHPTANVFVNVSRETRLATGAGTVKPAVTLQCSATLHAGVVQAACHPCSPASRSISGATRVPGQRFDSLRSLNDREPSPYRC